MELLNERQLEQFGKMISKEIERKECTLRTEFARAYELRDELRNIESNLKLSMGPDKYDLMKKTLKDIF